MDSRGRECKEILAEPFVSYNHWALSLRGWKSDGYQLLLKVTLKYLLTLCQSKLLLSLRHN